VRSAESPATRSPVRGGLEIVHQDHAVYAATPSTTIQPTVPSIVVRFGEQRPVHRYLTRGEERRLLLIVMSLGLVIVLMLEARKPERWQWLWGISSNTSADVDPGGEIDTRLAPAPAARPIEGFVVVSPPEREPDGQGDVQRRLLPGIDLERLRTIEDDTVLRPQEHDAFYHLFGVLSATDEDAMAAASLGQATFVQLFQQPGTYRGEVVAIDGTVRGVYELTAGTNSYGVERYYQLWLQPPDRRLPIVVQCLELPEGFPTGTSLDEPIRVVGIFYKRWAYLAQDALRTAPMILARTVHWEPVATSEAPTGEPSGSLTWALVMTAALAATVFVVRMVVRRERSFHASNAEVATPSAEDWQRIGDQLPDAKEPHSSDRHAADEGHVS